MSDCHGSAGEVEKRLIGAFCSRAGVPFVHCRHKDEIDHLDCLETADRKVVDGFVRNLTERGYVPSPEMTSKVSPSRDDIALGEYCLSLPFHPKGARKKSDNYVRVFYRGIVSYSPPVSSSSEGVAA